VQIGEVEIDGRVKKPHILEDRGSAPNLTLGSCPNAVEGGRRKSEAPVTCGAETTLIASNTENKRTLEVMNQI